MSWTTTGELYDTGRNPMGRTEVGLEWRNGVSCSFTHLSHLRDGAPFNNRPEWGVDTLGCDVKFGGY